MERGAIRRGSTRVVPCLLSLLMAVTAIRASADAVVIVDLEPGRRDSLMVCTLETRGLPDPRSAETLESGLPSALVIAFSLIGANGDEVGHSRVEVRIEPDLWEQVFVIRTPFLDQRVESLDEVTSFLGRLGPLPVLPMGDLDWAAPLRLRSRLAVHPLAPAEIERVQSLFGGDSGTDDEPDRREVSVGLGSLVRYFLGGHPDEDWVTDVTSRVFTGSALAEEP